MGLFFKMVMRSVKRRRREMRFVSAAVFIAVLFLSGISVFQNVMNRYVTEKNYLNYGEWILSVTEELKSEEPAPFERLEHPYLLEKGISSTGGEVLDRDGVGTGKYVGAIDEAFAEMGNVSLYGGRLPENSDEIAMDLPALAAMGYSYDLGQTISIGVQTDEYGNIARKEFELVGTIRSFASNWNTDSSHPLPSCIVTEEGLEAVGGTFNRVWFYQLDRAYQDIDIDEFTAPFLKSGLRCTYNLYAYEQRLWGSPEMFAAVKLILLVVAAVASGYLLISYENGRRKWYYQYRTIGAERSQIRLMILIEGIYGAFPWALAAQVIPHLLGAAICAGVSAGTELPYLYEFLPGEVFLQAGVVFGVLFLVILAAWIVSGDRSLVKNTKTVTERQLRRIRKCRAKKKLLKSFFVRQRKLYPFRQAAAALFTVIVCMVMVLCAEKINTAILAYEWAEKSLTDFDAEKIVHYEYAQTSYGVVEINGVPQVSERTVGCGFYNMYEGLTEADIAQIESLIGVESMERELLDERHILLWDGKKESPMLEQYISMDEAHSGIDWEKGEHPCARFLFYDDYSSFLEKTGVEAEGEKFDREKFDRGEQVIILIREQYFLGSEVPDPGIAAGDRLTIESRDWEGKTETEAGAVMSVDDEQELDFYGLYNVIGSYKLAEKIAAADGQTLQIDRIGLDFNGDASYESTEKQLASMFEAKEMSFYSNIETIRVNAENMVRGVSIYGSMMAVGISVYLVLQLNMRRNQGFYLRGEYRLFRRMGMEERTFHRMALSDGVKQAVWVLAGIPCAYILIFCQKYAEQVRLAEASKGQGMIYEVYSNLLNGFTQNLPVLALDRVLIDAAPLWELSVCILMIIVFLISTAVGIRSMEKGESRL